MHRERACRAHAGTQFTCFTGTKVHRLTRSSERTQRLRDLEEELARERERDRERQEVLSSGQHQHEGMHQLESIREHQSMPPRPSARAAACRASSLAGARTRSDRAIATPAATSPPAQQQTLALADIKPLALADIKDTRRCAPRAAASDAGSDGAVGGDDAWMGDPALSPKISEELPGAKAEGGRDEVRAHGAAAAAGLQGGSRERGLLEELHIDIC